MAIVTLDYDPSGSDTLASGSGPATAVTGSSATNGVGAVVNLDGSPDLSGVAVDSVLFAASASGLRHLSRILAVDNSAKTVTTEDTLTLGVGVLWAIGGTRKTLEYDNTMNDVNQGKAGWTFSLASGNYPMAGNGSHIFTPVAGTLADGPVSVVAAAGAATKPVVPWTNDFRLFHVNGANVALSGLSFSNTASVVTSVNCLWARNSSSAFAEGCDFEAPTGVAADGSRLRLANCGISGSLSYGIDVSKSAVIIDSSIVLDCALSGINIRDLGGGTSINRSIVARCLNHGVIVTASIAAQKLFNLSNSVLHKNTYRGLYLAGTASVLGGPFLATNNIFTENGLQGIGAASNIDLLTYADYNAFYNNTSGSYNNITAGPNDVALTADPFTDSAAGDFTLNNAAGGGALLRGTGLGYAGP